MQDIIVVKPYQFVPPHKGRIWPWLIVHVIMQPYLRHYYGIRHFDCRQPGKIKASLNAGHRVVVVANHTRPCDPMAAGWLTRVAKHPMYCMASWHVFMNSHIDRFLIRRCGAYSVYREGNDHASLNFSINSLVQSDRPIILFAEGSVTRSNDIVRPMLDGAALIARTAARRLAKQDPSRKVVIHPVAFKYFFRGNLEASVTPVLKRLEKQLSLSPQDNLPLVERIRRLGRGLVRLRELEFLGAPQEDGENSPGFHDRIASLIEQMLRPLEQQYVLEPDPHGVYARVQVLRSRIVPELVEGTLSAAEEQQRWQQLRTLYVAQDLGCYPRNYLADNPSTERILETIERLEENLTDRATIHKPLDGVMQVGDAIEVPTRRERGLAVDPLTTAARSSISEMIQEICQNPPAA
jgi:1-acyl-sn-glycerol-3-phosphate acyltransferase